MLHTNRERSGATRRDKRLKSSAAKKRASERKGRADRMRSSDTAVTRVFDRNTGRIYYSRGGHNVPRFTCPGGARDEGGSGATETGPRRGGRCETVTSTLGEMDSFFLFHPIVLWDDGSRRCQGRAKRSGVTAAPTTTADPVPGRGVSRLF